MFSRAVRRAWPFVCSLACVTAIVVGCFHLPHVNETTVALMLVLAILAIASRWGFPEAVVASVLAGLEFDYYFLPPLGLRIDEPHHLLTQVALLTTAILGGRLSAKAKKKASEAEARKEELQKLLTFQQEIHAVDDLLTNLGKIPECIERAFSFGGVALYVHGAHEIHRYGAFSSFIPDDLLVSVASNRKICVDKQRSLTVLPASLGPQSPGSVGVHGTGSKIAVLQAILSRIEVEVERARSQEEAQRAEATRKSEELRSVMLDALAHDLKTPLTTVKAAITCLLAEDSCPNKELLHAINEEADHLNHLITETISIARVEAGDIQLDAERYDIKDVIEKTLQEMEPVLAGRPVQIQTPVDSPEVAFDFDLVKTVLKQLLDNAAKYSPSGAPVTVSCDRSREEVVVHVADVGTGIPENEHEHVFDRFYRSRDDVPGTGMGLAIAKRIIEAHGGRIWVGSRPATGSVFHFSLPFHKELLPSTAKEF